MRRASDWTAGTSFGAFVILWAFPTWMRLGIPDIFWWMR